MKDIEEGRRVLRVEAQSILDAVERLDQSFVDAIDLIFACKGKLIITGIGKSGQIGRKISSTFSSTGTPSVFLHPAEGAHGDLGMVTADDLVLAISYGGESEEMASLLRHVSRKAIPMIAITGRKDSSLAQSAQAVLDVVVKEEACPLKLAPTSSSTVTLALGDALAMAVLKRRGFKQEDFAEFHPNGTLGRRLLTRVSDVMFSGDSLPIVHKDEKMTKVLSTMAGREVRGVAGVVDADGSLVGVITDGDVTRRLEKTNKPFTENAEQIMSHSPKTIDANEMAEKALFVMEQFRVNRLFVIDKNGDNPRKPVGFLDFQNLLQAKIR